MLAKSVKIIRLIACGAGLGAATLAVGVMGLRGCGLGAGVDVGIGLLFDWGACQIALGRRVSPRQAARETRPR